MDWKYKHFSGVSTYPQPSDEVLAQSRGFVAETLRWKVTETADGFRATGVSFAHVAIATFHVSAAGGSTRVIVELAVERAGYMGFMLWDVGGYYNGQIAHWLEGIADRLAGRVGAAAPHRPPSSGARLMSWMLMFAAVGFGIWGVWTFVFGPLIGIATGELYLIGRGGGMTLHGAWARGVSAAFLAADVVIAFQLLRRRRRAQPIGWP